MTKPIVQCNNVCKTISGTRIIKNVNFKVSMGERVMLLGGNGAGKSMLFNLLLGLTKASSGTISLQGVNPHLPSARVETGVVFQQSDFMRELSVIETIKFIKSHYEDSFAVDELLDIFMLKQFESKLTGDLSLGQKRRLALSLAFISRPKIIFLDEPTVGLDVKSRHNILSFIRDYSHKLDRTLLLTTHLLEEAEMLTDRVIYLKDGKIISDCAKNSFKNRYLQTTVCFSCDKVLDFCFVENIVSSMSVVNNQVTLMTTDADRLICDLVNYGIPFKKIQVTLPTLENAYVSDLRN